MSQWQVKATMDTGGTVMFGVPADDAESAREVASSRAPDGTQALEVTEIKQPHLREGYRTSDRHRH